LDEQIELLAHHALRAEMWERALLYLRRAADKASSRWAFREAARYLELALNAVGHLPERGDLFGEEIDIRLDLRTALTPAAQFNRIAEVIAGAITLAERIGDRTRLAWAFAYHAFISIERCEQQQALESGLWAARYGARRRNRRARANRKCPVLPYASASHFGQLSGGN
jgi:predicted ATPase